MHAGQLQRLRAGQLQRLSNTHGACTRSFIMCVEIAPMTRVRKIHATQPQSPLAVLAVPVGCCPVSAPDRLLTAHVPGERPRLGGAGWHGTYSLCRRNQGVQGPPPRLIGHLALLGAPHALQSRPLVAGPAAAARAISGAAFDVTFSLGGTTAAPAWPPPVCE